MGYGTSVPDAPDTHVYEAYTGRNIATPGINPTVNPKKAKPMPVPPNPFASGAKMSFGVSGGGGTYTGPIIPGNYSSGWRPGMATGTPASGGTGQTGSAFTNYAKDDPNITKATQMMQQRYQQLAGKEGQMDPYLMESIENLRRQQGSDQTHRATDQATSAIRDYGAGQEQALDARRAQQGSAGGGYGQLAEAGQRAQAKAAAQIQMNEQQRQDQLALGGAQILGAPSQLGLAQSGQTNALLGSLYGGADMQARNALGQQTLGLEQWKAQNNPQYNPAYQQQMMNLELQKAQMGLAGQGLGLQGQQMDLYGRYLQMLQGAGYGGGYGY